MKKKLAIKNIDVSLLFSKNIIVILSVTSYFIIERKSQVATVNFSSPYSLYYICSFLGYNFGYIKIAFKNFWGVVRWGKR